MEKHCINCKREIAPIQKECLVCGASQSYFRYYLKTGLVFLLLLSGLAVAGYRTIQQSTKQAVLDNAIQAEAKMEGIVKKLQQVEVELEQANQKIQQTEENSEQSNETAAQDKSKLNEAESRVKKAEARSKWLSKENAQMKVKIKELTDKVSTTEQALSTRKNTQKNVTNLQVESLKKELIQFESQKQSLVDTIALKQKQLEDGWQQASTNDANPPTAEILSQREQQLKQTTQVENDQLLLLNNQIEETKKKISDLE